MISFGNALSFAFSKKSFIVGSILLFLTILLMFILGYTFYRLGPDYVQRLGNIPLKTWENIGYTLYGAKAFFFSILWAYFYILAKKSVYNQSMQFSKEFFWKVVAVIFSFSVLSSIVMYTGSQAFVKWVIPFFITKQPTILNVVLFVSTLVFSFLGMFYCITSVYMAYLMHFNFSQFFFKLKYTFSNPITFFKIVGLFVAFIMLSFIPIIGLYFVLGSFDARTVVMSFLSCIMGTGASTSLFIYTILIGIPIAIFCINTKGGRIFGLCVTLWYFILYGVIRLMGMPAFPMPALFYLYAFFFIFTLLYVIFTIVYPCFFIHLLSQGALEINRKFMPTVGLSDEEKMLLNSSVGES